MTNVYSADEELRALIIDHIVRIGRGGELLRLHIRDESLLSACGIDSFAMVTLLIDLTAALVLDFDRVHELSVPLTVGDIIHIVTRARAG